MVERKRNILSTTNSENLTFLFCHRVIQLYRDLIIGSNNDFSDYATVLVFLLSTLLPAGLITAVQVFFCKEISKFRALVELTSF